MAELTGIAKQVMDDYTAWRGFTDSYRKNWFNYWKLWNNKRVNRRYKATTSDSFDPMTHQIVESRVDNIYGSRPKLTFLPTQPEQDKDTKLLAEMFDYTWDRNNMDLNIIPMGREEEITGNTIVFLGWEDGFMSITHVPIADCIGDTTATNPDNVKKIGYRRLALLEDLKKEKVFDPTKGEKGEDGNPKGQWVPKYKNLDKITKYSAKGTDDLDKALKEQMYAGSTLPDDQKSQQVEVIRMMYLDKVVELGNRGNTPIFESDNIYQAPKREVEVQLHSENAEPMYDEKTLPPEFAQMTPEELDLNREPLAQALQPAKTKITVPAIEPFLPFAMGRNFIDPSVLLAKGTVETFSDSQEDLNDELNIKKDNLIARQQNNALVDSEQFDSIVPRLAKAKANDFIPARGIAKGENPVQWIEKPELAADADVEIARLKQSIRDTARVDQVVQGVGTQNDRTATEVSAQVAGATAGFNTQTRNLESGLFKQVGDKFYKMVQIFMTAEQIVRVVGPEGVEFKKFDPSKYFGDYDCKVTLESQAKAAHREEAQRYIEVYKLFNGDPTFNQIELKKLVAQKAFDMDDDDLELLMSPDPMNQAMMGGAPAGDAVAGTPGGVTPPPMAQPAPQS